MDGIHDMGGMDGFGAIGRAPEEPIFHTEWERRTVGMVLNMFAQRFFQLDEYRQKIERMTPVAYLGPYYARWFHAATTLLVEKGLLTREELASGRAAGKATGVDLLPGDAIPGLLSARISEKQNADIPANFRPGDIARARNIHPQHHTRSPRYIRGKTGTVERDYGVFTFPDSHAQNIDQPPQHVYNVRFTVGSRSTGPRCALYRHVGQLSRTGVSEARAAHEDHRTHPRSARYRG